MRFKWVLLLFLLTGCVGCDQVSKGVAIDRLSGIKGLSYLGDTVRLVYAENTGAFLGLGEHWPPVVRWGVFTVLSAVFVIAAGVYALRQIRGVTSWRGLCTAGAIGLVAAGGLGNLIDRFCRNGAVVDFMNLGIGPVRTGIFNVADVQIMLGCALFAFGDRRASPATPRVHRERKCGNTGS
ncbi:MAG TPA: signal peptidase II [Polyangiaceae bacterium]|nr:signal peptidase II [Polyangiaceae bacterium]